MNEWNIQSRAHACQACEKHFSDKQHYHTLLIDHKHEVQRCDLCEPCWKKEVEGHAAETKGFISQWQGVYEAPPAAPPEAIQKENAESLLRKIMEQNEPKYAAASYILAVMLERKRLLKIKEQFKRDGQRVFVYEQPKTGDIFTIPRSGFAVEPARRGSAHGGGFARARPRRSSSCRNACLTRRCFIGRGGDSFRGSCGRERGGDGDGGTGCTLTLRRCEHSRSSPGNAGLRVSR